MAALQKSVASTSSQVARSHVLLAAQPLAPRMCFQQAAPCLSQRRVALAPVAALPTTADDAKIEASNSELLNLPTGYHWYETMLIFKPTLSTNDRNRELAKFEIYLGKEACININAFVKGVPSKLAYPIKNEMEGMFVLYTFAAKRQTARAVQLLLSNPEAGSEDKLLRHMTLLKY